LFRVTHVKQENPAIRKARILPDGDSHVAGIL